jgi:hypothetical protein
MGSVAAAGCFPLRFGRIYQSRPGQPYLKYQVIAPRFAGFNDGLDGPFVPGGAVVAFDTGVLLRLTILDMQDGSPDAPPFSSQSAIKPPCGAWGKTP